MIHVSTRLSLYTNVLTVLRALLGARVSGETSVSLQAGQMKSFSRRCSRIPTRDKKQTIPAKERITSL